MSEGVSEMSNRSCGPLLIILPSTSANELCITEELYQIQNVTGTITTSNIASIINQISSGDQSIPQNVTCGNCSKAAYTIASKDFPQLVSNSTSHVQATCGSSFTGLSASVLVYIRDLHLFSPTRWSDAIWHPGDCIQQH